jgi:hypothetical protein
MDWTGEKMKRDVKLSKVIPARRKTLKFKWLNKEFTKFTESFRNIRPKDTCCYWCKGTFQEGDILGLACPEKGRNRLLCQKCCEEAE